MMDTMTRTRAMLWIEERSRDYNPAPGRQVFTPEGARRYGLPIGATILPGMRKLTDAQQDEVAAMPAPTRAKYLQARSEGKTHAAARTAAGGSAPKRAPAKKAAAEAPAKKAAPTGDRIAENPRRLTLKHADAATIYEFLTSDTDPRGRPRRNAIGLVPGRDVSVSGRNEDHLTLSKHAVETLAMGLPGREGTIDDTPDGPALFFFGEHLPLRGSSPAKKAAPRKAPAKTAHSAGVKDAVPSAPDEANHESIGYYQSGANYAINGYLRTGKLPSHDDVPDIHDFDDPDFPDENTQPDWWTEKNVKKWTAELDGLMQPTTRPMTVHRGRRNLDSILRDTGAESLDDLVGREYTDKGFVSTTARASWADSFAGSRRGEGAGGAKLEIRVPAGTRAFRMTDGGEDEAVLDRGLTYRVVEVRRGDKPTVVVEVVPRAKKSTPATVEPAGTVRATRSFDRFGGAERRIIADGTGGYVGQRRERGGEWKDDPALGSGRTVADILAGPYAGTGWRRIAAPTPAKKSTPAAPAKQSALSERHLAALRDSANGLGAKRPTTMTTGANKLAALEDLRARGLVRYSGGHYRITDAGRAELDGPGPTPAAPRVSAGVKKAAPARPRRVSVDVDEVASRIMTARDVSSVQEILMGLNVTDLRKVGRGFGITAPATAPDGSKWTSATLAAYIANQIRGGRQSAWRSYDNFDLDEFRDDETDEEDPDEELDEEDPDEEDEPDDAPVLTPATRSRILEFEFTTRALGHDTPGHDEFETYWTRGEGLARWLGRPHEWTTLRNLLRKHPAIHDPEGLATKYFHKVKGFYPGSDLHRVEHGKPPRGERIGPG